MSKRRFTITFVGGETLEFNLENIFQKFKSTDIFGFEITYQIIDEVDAILDLKEGETIHFYEDRAKEYPCLLTRLHNLN